MFIDACATFGDMLSRNIQEVCNNTNKIKNVNNPFISFSHVVSESIVIGM